MISCCAGEIVISWLAVDVVVSKRSSCNMITSLVMVNTDTGLFCVVLADT